MRSYSVGNKPWKELGNSIIDELAILIFKEDSGQLLNTRKITLKQKY